MMKQFSFDSLNLKQLLCVFLFVGLLAYGNAIFHPFVHDDTVFIVNNPNINQLDVQSVFKPKEIGGASADLVNVYYRPLIELAYRLQYKMFGLNPHGFHLVNIVVHSVNAFLLFILFSLYLKIGRNVSLMTAMIFLVHPIQTEAVSCVSGISNLLLTLFFLGSFITYIRSKELNSRRDYVFSLLILFLGCLVKEQMVVLPVLMAFYEMTLGAKGKKSWGKIAGLFTTLAGYFIFRRLILGFSLTHIFDPYGEHWLRFASIGRSLLNYLSLIVWPANLHYYRSIDVLQPNILSWIILAAISVAVLAIVLFNDRSKRNILLFGVGWFFITLLPMLNIVPLVNEYSTILNFEHFLYIPMIGIVLFLVTVIRQCVKRYQNISDKMKLIFSVLIVAICVLLSLKQNTYWSSEIALFKRSLRYQESGRIRILLGKAYYFNKEYEKSLNQYDKAHAIMDGYIQKTGLPKIKQFYNGFIKGIYFDKAHCYEALQKIDLAVKMYNQAIERDPKDEVLYNNLAVLYIKNKEYPRAIEYLEQALSLDRNSMQTKQNLAYCYVQLGQKEKADQLFK